VKRILQIRDQPRRFWPLKNVMCKAQRSDQRAKFMKRLWSWMRAGITF